MTLPVMRKERQLMIPIQVAIKVMRKRKPNRAADPDKEIKRGKAEIGMHLNRLWTASIYLFMKQM